jgi:hypothetical protein
MFSFFTVTMNVSGERNARLLQTKVRLEYLKSLHELLQIDINIR